MKSHYHYDINRKMFKVHSHPHRVNLSPQTLYRYVLEDVYEFPTLEKDLKEFQKLLRRRQ